MEIALDWPPKKACCRVKKKFQKSFVQPFVHTLFLFIVLFLPTVWRFHINKQEDDNNYIYR